MDSQPIRRCTHFQLHSEPLGHDGPPAYLAIRHCLLAGRMLLLLNTVPEAEPLAKRLVIQTERGVYAFVGPDLEAVTQQTCSFQRCDHSCTPAYRQLLQQFMVTDPREEEVTCDDHEEAAEQVRQTESASCA